MPNETREYSSGGVTIVWRPSLCAHSGNCVRGLPAVFDRTRRPWIDASAATADAIVAQVARCPSGALTCRRKPSS